MFSEVEDRSGSPELAWCWGIGIRQYQPALFMTVRDETDKTPGEMGVRRHERPRRT